MTSTNSTLIFALPGNGALASALALHLGATLGELAVRRFPDGETYLRFVTPVSGRRIVLICSLHHPDNHAMPLLFAAATAKELGASAVGLVTPYLGYMRQDKRFNDGEAVTSALFARMLSQHIDWLVTVDPHLHRWHSLDQIYSVPSTVVPAAPMLAAWVRDHVKKPLLIGPDSESEQWVSAVASIAGAQHIVLEKVRRGDQDVSVSMPDPAVLNGKTPVLVDDIISTGHTMIAASLQLKGLGLPSPVCVGVHGLFVNDARDRMIAAGCSKIVTTNTIPEVCGEITIDAAVCKAVSGYLC